MDMKQGKNSVTGRDPNNKSSGIARLLKQSFHRCVARIQHAKFFHALEQIELNQTRLHGKSSCTGKMSIFDCLLPRSEPSRELRFSAADLGSCETALAKQLFCWRLIKRIPKIPAPIPLHWVTSITASSSDISGYESLAEFGELAYQMHRSQDTCSTDQQYLEQCLSSALEAGGSEFELRLWTPGIRWINCDGSHRFGAAYHIAQSQQVPAVIKAHVDIYALDTGWLKSLIEYFELIFVTVHLDALYKLVDIFEMRSSASTYIIVDSTSVDEHITALLLLARCEPLTVIAAPWLQQKISNYHCVPLEHLLDEYRAHANFVQSQVDQAGLTILAKAVRRLRELH